LSGGGSTPTSGSGGRPGGLRNLQNTISTTTSGSDLQANITNFINNQINNVANKTVYDTMKTVFDSYKFPKMMIIHRGVEVASASQKVINFVYHLEVLDYLDPLTGNPNVFDVYLQKYQVIVDTGALFSSSPNMVEFIVVNKIEKNSFDSIQNSGAYISYKLFSDSQQIYVKYVSFTDVLGVFGGFYSIFSLFAAILSGLYNELFLEKKLISSVFKFIDNKPENIIIEDILLLKNNKNLNNNIFLNNYEIKKNTSGDPKFIKNKILGNKENNKLTNIINFSPYKDDKQIVDNKNIEMLNLNNNKIIEVEKKLNKSNLQSINQYFSKFIYFQNSIVSFKENYIFLI